MKGMSCLISFLYAKKRVTIEASDEGNCQILTHSYIRSEDCAGDDPNSTKPNHDPE